MTINWGAKIAILYLGFVSLIVTLVVLSSMKKLDLVTADYYQQELQFQQKLDAAKNMTELKEPIQLERSSGALLLHFPASFSGAMKNISIQFYAPSSSAKDYRIDLKTTENEVRIPQEKLANVPYKVRVNWMADGKAYYQELSY